MLTLSFFLKVNCTRFFWLFLMLNIPFQHTAGQLRSRKTSTPGSAKAPEHADVVTFDDVAGVDEAKEELEEIVVCRKFLTHSISDIVVYRFRRS